MDGFINSEWQRHDMPEASITLLYNDLGHSDHHLTIDIQSTDGRTRIRISEPVGSTGDTHTLLELSTIEDAETCLDKLQSALGRIRSELIPA